MKFCKDWKNKMQEHMIIASIILSVLAGMLLFFCFALMQGDIESIMFSFTIGPFVGIFFIFPIILTGYEFYTLLKVKANKEIYERGRCLDVVTISCAVLYTVCYLIIIKNAAIDMDWDVQLANAQMHAPIYTEAVPMIWVIMLVAFVGYLIVNFVPLDKLPPLLLVISLSTMYLGVLESICVCIQTLKGDVVTDLYLLLLPLNCVIITVKTIGYKIREWKKIAKEYNRMENKLFLKWCNRLLQKSELWPVIAFLIMWPLLGFVLGILILFGQSPSLIIRAWTETSDWNLSQQVSPQNIYYDEHYLCTVAAGGDCLFFFVGNMILWLLNMNHPGIICLALVVIFFGISVSVAAAVLSRLIKKAADLQEQSDWTI